MFWHLLKNQWKFSNFNRLESCSLQWIDKENLGVVCDQMYENVFAKTFYKNCLVCLVYLFVHLLISISFHAYLNKLWPGQTTRIMQKDRLHYKHQSKNQGVLYNLSLLKIFKYYVCMYRNKE